MKVLGKSVSVLIIALFAVSMAGCHLFSNRTIDKVERSLTSCGVRNVRTYSELLNTSLQLKNLVVTYNIPKSFCNKLSLSSATASIIGDNVYMWTPDQSRTRNSYKTMRFPGGLTRSVSAQLILNF